MTWIIEVAIGNLTRYWSADRDLVYERKGAKTYADFAEAVKTAQELERDHRGRITAKTKRST